MLSGDAMCKALVKELYELSLRVADEREYEHTGRACFLTGISSHSQQCGSSVRLSHTMTEGIDNFGPAFMSRDSGNAEDGGAIREVV